MVSITKERSKKIIEEAQAELTSQPNSKKALINLARVYEELGQYDKSIYYFIKLAKLISSSSNWVPQVWGNIALIVNKALQYSNNKSLVNSHQYYPKTISQIGQDYWVINEVFNRKKNGYFFEIGSNDGVTINNTYLLEKVYGWSGICVEANPMIFDALKANRSSICVNSCIFDDYGQVEFIADNLLGGVATQGSDNHKRLKRDKKLSGKKIIVDTVPLVDLLQEHQAPKIIDYFSIDVEGAEEQILKRFPFQDYTFCCLTIERPNEFVQKLLLNNGYLIVKVIPGLDTFFIHSSFRDKYRENLKNYYVSRNQISYDQIETKSNLETLLKTLNLD